MLKKRKILFTMTLIILILGTAACGKQNQAVTEPIDSNASTSATETATGETESVTDSSKGSADENTIVGTVSGGTEHSISIIIEDGTELEFYIGDDTIEDYEDGYLIDRKVIITYTGQIDGADNNSVKVIKVSDYK